MEMPKELEATVRDMGGSDVTLVADMRLHDYDVSRNLNRLLLPQCEIKSKFLTLAELSLLMKCEMNHGGSFLTSDEVSLLNSSKAEISVKFLEASWKNEEEVEYKDFGDAINLKRRAMTGSYLLTTGLEFGFDKD